MRTTREHSLTRTGRVLLGLMLAAAMGTLAVRSARPAEIIPSIGMTRAVNGGDKVETYGSLGLRGNLVPMVKSEIGVAYRSESRFDNTLTVKTWPITASLWLQPIPALYAGGGVGWYQITNDYDQSKIAFPIQDKTQSEFGVHLGGGLRVPLAPAAAIDLNGRYVMMREQESPLIPQKFDPDFWTTSLGLAIGF